MPHPKFSMEEHVRRGETLYEDEVRQKLDPSDHGKILALDIQTGEYELGESALTASRALLNRLPDAQIWCVRVGYPAVHRFGPRFKTV